METVFRNQLVSKNQSVRGNVFTKSFPRNGLHVTIFSGDQPHEIFVLKHLEMMYAVNKSKDFHST
jgi:hypothetical protein